MNNWITSSLLIGATLLAACSSANHNAPVPRAPMLKTNGLTTKQVKLVAPEFREDAPDRYIVKRGDTLWTIAGRFLKSPARWKEVWYANPQIKNPNKIYPGDILAYKTVGGVRRVQVAGSSNPIRSGVYSGKRTRDGRPVYNLSPSVEVELLPEPIPTVPKDAVFPFMTKNLVLEPGFSADYPYVVGQADGGFIALTGRDKVYARSDNPFDAALYNVYREGDPIKDPFDGVVTGVEATYVGQLKLVKQANEDGVATFVQTDKANPLYPKDILVPTKRAPEGVELSFLPKLPDVNGDVVVIRPLGAANPTTASQFSTLLISGGRDIGVTEGDVFTIVRAKEQMGRGRDGDTFKLPDYESGMGIVYKVNENTSYLLVMNAYDVIYPGDRLIRP